MNKELVKIIIGIGIILAVLTMIKLLPFWAVILSIGSFVGGMGFYWYIDRYSK